MKKKKQKKQKKLQQELLRKKDSSKIIFLMGAGGSGKTRLLSSLVAERAERVIKRDYDDIDSVVNGFLEDQKLAWKTPQDTTKSIITFASALKSFFSPLLDILDILADILSSILKRTKSKSKPNSIVKENVLEPSKFGEYLLYLFLSKKERENLIGDLVEEYKEIYTKFGRKKAKIWFYKQVYSSIWPLVRRIVIKWGLVAWLAELVRRIVP